MRSLFEALTAIGLLPILVHGQQEKEKFPVFVTGLDTASPVMDSIKKLLDSSKPFRTAEAPDSSRVAVLVSCMDRKQGEAYSCLYVSHYVGATFRTFLGAGISNAPTVEDTANNLLGAIVKDIVERFNDIDKQHSKEALETCLMLTESKCNVPDPIQKELGVQQLTLGQYLSKQHRQ